VAGDEFGERVSIQGDYVVVGASRDDDALGSAYVFYNDPVLGWTQQKKLTAADGEAWAYFGVSISDSGVYIVIGASTGTNENGIRSGAVYIFYNDPVDGWINQSKLFDSDGIEYDELGFSSSISGNTVLAGAYGDDDNGEDSGSVFFYDYTPPVCGDGAKEGFEVCDDGNLLDGDGCSSTCQLEHSGIGCSFTFDELPGVPATDSFCAGACHDAFGYSGGYSPDASHCLCDDQTTIECDALCVTLAGFGVTNPICLFIGGGVCGDGNLDAGEECDDGNTSDGDGCSATCTIEGACGALGEGEICISGEVDGGVALTAGSDVTLSVDPANQSSGEDTDNTGVNTLTVWNNNVDGFDVTVALVGDDTNGGGTANTLGIATTTDFLNGTDGTIKFKSTENAGGPGLDDLAGGTGVDTFALYTTDEIVYTNDNSTDGICAAGTITVDHELSANVEVVPGSYTGTATYTIAVHV
jgi:cysteine-rich repeat protein